MAYHCAPALQKRLLLHEEAVRTNERVMNPISAHSDHSSTLLRAPRGSPGHSRWLLTSMQRDSRWHPPEMWACMRSS